MVCKRGVPGTSADCLIAAAGVVPMKRMRDRKRGVFQVAVADRIVL